MDYWQASSIINAGLDFVRVSKMMRKRRLWADLALLMVAFIWGIAFVVQRLAAAEVQAFTFNGVRFLLGALVILPLAFVRARRRTGSGEVTRTPGSLSDRYLPGVLLAGVLLASGAAFQQIGIKYTTASNAGFITGLYVVLIPIFLSFGGRRKIPRPVVWIAALLSSLGLYLLSTGGRFQINRGDILVMVSAVFWTLHVILIDWMVQRVEVMQFAAGQYIVCGLASLGLGLYLEPEALKPVASNWCLLAYMGVISVGLGYTLQAVGQRVAPPADTAIILSMEAVFAALGGWLFLGESLAKLQLLGCGIILLGMLLAQSDLILGKRQSLLDAEEKYVSQSFQ
jgi:drug/metabolite transporter (DMT)-like permease